jgi:hypothetical protein
VTLLPSRKDANKNVFVDSNNKGGIVGSVVVDKLEPLGGVILTLKQGTDATSETATDGSYTFPGVVPCDGFVIETKPGGCPSKCLQ